MKKLMLLISSFLAFAFLNAACVHKIVYADGTATAKNDKSIPTAQATVVWLKNKEDSIHLMLKLENPGHTAFYVKQGSFHLEFNGEKVTPANVPAFFEIQPGEQRQQLAIFKFSKGKLEVGNAVFTLDPITEGVIEKPGKTLGSIKLVLPVQD